MAMEVAAAAAAYLTPQYKHPISLLRKPLTTYRRINCSSSSSETLTASKYIDDEYELKSWMRRNGLPNCKVVLKEKPSPLPLRGDAKHPPIHYVAASEDLQSMDEDCNDDENGDDSKWISLPLNSYKQRISDLPYKEVGKESQILDFNDFDALARSVNGAGRSSNS